LVGVREGRLRLPRKRIMGCRPAWRARVAFIVVGGGLWEVK
jgi:hypothetical protein